jgi:hypothetical protein
VIVPAALGLRGARQAFGRVNTARCRARVWSLDPTGVVHFTGRTTLADIFGVWGRRLTPARLRIGASSLLNDVLMQKDTEASGRYSGLDYFTID